MEVEWKRVPGFALFFQRTKKNLCKVLDNQGVVIQTTRMSLVLRERARDSAEQRMVHDARSGVARVPQNGSDLCNSEGRSTRWQAPLAGGY
jgi:hypothetical protein